MTESFSQFEVEALTRYLKPIGHPRGQHTTSNMRVNRFRKRILATHAERLVSNGPPPHPMTTMSKLGPWSRTFRTVPLVVVEVEGDPWSSLSSKAPTLIRQSRCNLFSRWAYRSEIGLKKPNKYFRSVLFDSLTNGKWEWKDMARGMVWVGVVTGIFGARGRSGWWRGGMGWTEEGERLYTGGRRKAHTPLEAVR